jgi:glycosyltransferase involved in cell wall biosynthesis
MKLASVCDLIVGTWGGEVEPGLIAEAARSGLRMQRFRFPFHPFQNTREMIRSIRECCRVLDAEHIDLVHCQSYRHLILCRLASSLSRHKPALVFTDHNSDGRRGMRIVPRLGLLAAVRPQVIDLDNYLSRIPFLRKKAVWVPNPVDTSFFRQIERPDEFSKTVSLVYPARLHVDKGHCDLLEICSRLKQRGLSFKLTLAGEGPALHTLQQLVARLDLQDVVHFAGHLRKEELLRELLAADIGVFPSFFEMLPCAVLEMMATALPVVAYAAGGIPLIIRHGETGFVTPIGAKADFEQHLATLMTNASLTRQFGCEAARDARSRFDIAVITRQLANLYQSCALAN